MTLLRIHYYSNVPSVVMRASECSPCGKATLNRCRRNKANLPECDRCTLVRRWYQSYVMIDRKPHKKCTLCGEVKPLDEFYYNSTRRGEKSYKRYSSECKECTRKRMKEYHHRTGRSIGYYKEKMKKTNNIIPYEVRFGKVCVTPCVNIGNIDGERPFVGSGRCRQCRHFHKIDTKKREVYCTYSKYSLDSGKSIHRGAHARKVMLIETGEKFDSARLAAIRVGISISSVSKSAKNGVKVLGEYTFQYI